MKLSQTPRVELRDPGYVLDPHAADVLDLATSGNVSPPPESIARVLRAVPLHTPPDPAARRAREAIAARLGTHADRVLLGNGASELLWTCGRTLAHAGGTVLVVLPGPGELAAAARTSGARVTQWRAVERTGHAVDLEQVRELIALERPSLVNVCAPAWPSGASVGFEEVRRLAAAFPETTFVTDQGELELSEQFHELDLAPPDNVVCVRSIGRTLGVSSVRAGYLWARPELCAYLDGRRPSFTTNGLAQAAAQLWAEHGDYVSACRSRLLADRDRLAAVLRAIGLAPTRSVTGGLLVRVARASAVAGALLERWRIAVRDCTSCGLPDHLRISGVPAAEAPRLQRALAEELARLGIPRGRET